MGLSIGQISGSLAALRSSPDFGQARLRDRTQLPELRTARAERESQGPLFGRQQGASARVGFGPGTLSPQGAALVTIGRTVDAVRRRTPTIGEIRERFRLQAFERRTENRRLGFERSDGNLLRRIERRIPEPAAQARNFVGRLNDVAGETLDRLESRELETGAQARNSVGRPNDAARETQDRLEGRERETGARGASIQINGEDFAFDGRESRFRIDVRA